MTASQQRFDLNCLTELTNRGIHDVFFMVYDKLKGLPDPTGQAFPATTAHTYLIHLPRNNSGYTSKKPLAPDHRQPHI